MISRTLLPKEDSNKYLLLSFFSDSERWDNIVKLVAYPSGITYDKPFRYRKHWIDPSLCNELPNFSGRDTSISGIVGMRFLDVKFQKTFIPIRKVTITRINNLKDMCNVHFTFGEMIDFTKYLQLDDPRLSFTISEDLESQREPFLFMKNQLLADPLFTDGTDEKDSDAWSQYVSLVNEDKIFPLRQEAKTSIFVKFSRMSTIKRLFISKEVGRISGFTLPEGKTLELGYVHRIPQLINKHKSIKTLRYAYKPGSLQVELNRLEEDFSSNYDEHFLMITGSTASRNYSYLSIEPETDCTNVKGEEIYAHAYEIPIKVNTNFWYRFVKQGIWYMMFAFGLVLQAIPNILSIETSNALSWGMPLGGVIFSTLALSKIK